MVLIATQSLKYENPNKFSLQHSQFLSSRIWCPGYGNLGQLPCQEMPIITTPLRFCCRCQQKKILAVVGGGPAGIFGAIRAKSIYPSLDILVLEKSQFLYKVKISGGGRCNVTTGLYSDPLALSGQYPRGYKELKGSFFRIFGPRETATWFEDRGVKLKIEEDGRMFPVSNTSMTIIECLLDEAWKLGVVLHDKTPVGKISLSSNSMFTIAAGGQKYEANYLLLATGSSRQGYTLAKQLGHTVVDPQPSLFTFKVDDKNLQSLAGVSFPVVRLELQFEGQKQKNPKFSQMGPMLITHWGLSGPVVLRLSAWAARDFFASDYHGTLYVDFEPNSTLNEVVNLLSIQKKNSLKRKLGSFSPSGLSIVRRFWEYLLTRIDINQDDVWASLNNASIQKLATLIKRCKFSICGKGEFKEEFVTAGGVPLLEVDLKTMESRMCPNLYFAGEVLNIDGITGGFNFQNAWTGGYIAGTSIGLQADGGSFSSHKEMMAAMKGIMNALIPTVQNQACMWSEPDLVGWLEKRGGKFTSWKKRFFVLQQSYLFYFGDDLKVQDKVPLGVIPLDSSKVEMKQDDTSRTSKKFTFHIYLGKQFVGYSKRDTYVVAAPSHQALDEWVQRLEIAADSREALIDQLRKARWRGADIRRMLANSYGNQEILEFAATKPEGQALMAELTKVQDGIGKLEGEVAGLEAQANQQEGALMRAIVVWDILDHYLSGKARGGEPTRARERIKIETEAIQQLYGLQQAKASYFQGQNIEYLLKQERDKLKVKVENSLYVVQERQAKIRSTAPRYSFNLDPKIFEDEGESLQQQFEPDVEGKKPAALKFYDNIQPLKLYDNIRAEVMETAEQLKTLKTTAMKVKEISGKVKDCIGPAMSVIEMVANSSMLTDMMKKRPSGKDSAVEGTSGDNAFEGNTLEWGQKNYQGETSSMQSQPRPGGRGMSRQESSGQMQYGSPIYGQSPGEYSGARGANSLPQSREMAPTRFPGSAQSNTQPPNQQPGGPYSQGFMPRGFQQQMSSMPQPPSPQSMQGFPGPGSTTPAMGMNFSGRSPGTMMPQQGGSMPPTQGQMQPMQGRMSQPGVPMQPTQGSMPQPGGPFQPMQGRMMPQPSGPMQPTPGRMPQPGGLMQPMQERMPQPGGPMQPMQGRMPQPGVPMQPTQGNMPQPGGSLQPMQGRMMPQPGGPMQGRMPQPGGSVQPMQGRMMPQPGGSVQPMQGRMMPQPGGPMQGRMPQPGGPMQPMQGRMPQPGGPMQPMQGMMPQPGGPMQPMQGRMPQPGGPMQLRMSIGQQGAMPPMQRGQQPTWSQMAPMQYPRPQ